MLTEISDERFQEIVCVLSKRLTDILDREAQLGRSTRVSGGARQGTEELNARLERLRDLIKQIVDQCFDAARSSPLQFDLKLLTRILRPATKALQRQSFKGMHAKTLQKELYLLCDAFEDAIGVFEVAVEGISDVVQPDTRLHLLSPEEVEGVFEGRQAPTTLIASMRAEAQLRHFLQHLRSLVADYYGWVPNRGGPYEKKRGAAFAIQLIAMAVGLGLKPTRSRSSPAISACDAAIAAISHQKQQYDPIPIEILSQIPKGFEGMAHLWNKSRNDEFLASYMSTGHALGTRLLQEKGLKSPS